MFVGGLHPETNEEHLISYFKQFGEIEDAVVMRDRERGGSSRGFAFLTFRTQEGADKACSARFVDLMNRRVCFVLLSFSLFR